MESPGSRRGDTAVAQGRYTSPDGKKIQNRGIPCGRRRRGISKPDQYCLRSGRYVRRDATALKFCRLMTDLTTPVTTVVRPHVSDTTVTGAGIPWATHSSTPGIMGAGVDSPWLHPYDRIRPGNYAGSFFFESRVPGPGQRVRGALVRRRDLAGCCREPPQLHRTKVAHRIVGNSLPWLRNIPGNRRRMYTVMYELP